MPPLRQNVELKARLPSLTAARRRALELTGALAARERQIDTYFVCAAGRLKLREIDNGRAQLVSYARADQAVPRLSDYQLVAVDDATGLKAALTAALGVSVVVDKLREVYLHGNVRIHLDQVAGLGEFVEFEAVLDAAIDAAAGLAQVRDLCGRFAIESSQVVAQSYSQLLLASQKPRA